MPLPFPNLPSTVDSATREYLRLIHSKLTELETEIMKLKQSTSMLNKRTYSLEELVKTIKDD